MKKVRKKYEEIRKARTIGTIIILAYFLFATITINSYGYTWDDKQEFSYAEANLNYILTKTGTVENQIAGYAYSPSNAGNLLGVIIKRVFSDWLGWTQKDNAYHFSGVIFGTLTLLLIFWFAQREFGLKTAIISSLTFATFPRIFGHIHNNVKDITVMFAYTLTLMCIYYLFTRREKKWLFYSAASLAFAFNTKFLTAFIIPIALIWFLTEYYLNKRNVKKNFGVQEVIENDVFKLKKYFSVWVKAAIIFVIILYILNPAYWIQPTNVVKTAFMLNHFENGPYNSLNKDYNNIIFGKIYSQDQTPSYFIPLMYLIVTPITIILLFLAGMIYIENFKHKASRLILIWLVIPILIYATLNITIYNIIRHVLFLFPAICIIAGLGGKKILNILNKLVVYLSKNRIKQNNRIAKRIIFTVFILLIFIWPVISIIQYHPYQTTYFNELVGGIKGAQGNFEVEYWGNSYKEGAEWINQNVKKGTTVVVPITEYIPSEYLRKDITIEKKMPSNQDSEIYVMFMRDVTDYNQLIWTLEKDYTPIHSVTVKGVPIVNIYRIPKANV